MHPSSSSEEVIRQLYQITNQYDQGLEHQLSLLIKLGLERFQLDIGILSKINQDTYYIQHCVVPQEIVLANGDSFELAHTYCSITYAKQAEIYLEHIGKNDQYASHPAYLNLRLESYIGIPIRVQGKLYGTLNFSSPAPYPRQFLATDIDALRLMASWIEVELHRRQQEQELAALNAKLKYQANYDSLTNVLNRRGMYKHLRTEINQLTRARHDATLAIIDIDHFKKLNDTYGHQTGDTVLTAIAKIITQSIRDFEMVARYGGEEFLLWLPRTNHQASGIVFQRIMKNIAELTCTHEPITISVGACYIQLTKPQPVDINALIDQVIGHADHALYEAKNNGRNRTVIYCK